MLVSSILIVSLAAFCDGFFGRGDPRTYATFCRYNVDHCLETLCGKLKTFTRRPDCKKDKPSVVQVFHYCRCEDVEECFSYQPLITPNTSNDACVIVNIVN
uniref:Uncharacterized protein n=1 Tax=Romanomermis culicivorax TaxID=13658 RepID=A0A915K6M1_ROMCU